MQTGQKRQSGPEHTQREGSRTVKGWYKALEDLVWLTQLGLNMLLPLVSFPYKALPGRFTGRF